MTSVEVAAMCRQEQALTLLIDHGAHSTLMVGTHTTPRPWGSYYTHGRYSHYS